MHRKLFLMHNIVILDERLSKDYSRGSCGSSASSQPWSATVSRPVDWYSDQFPANFTSAHSAGHLSLKNGELYLKISFTEDPSSPGK